MTNEVDNILRIIEAASPANEAEVETKILLYIFRLLGFTDIDRADKPSITMYYGREIKLKVPDFILYDGPERTLRKALITIEAKAIGIPLLEGISQAKSYAAWAGTPFYVVCNGESLLAVQFIPGAQEARTLTVHIQGISDNWPHLYRFLNRAEVILSKERLEYLSHYLPNVETLPPSEFFKEYLIRLRARFSLLAETRQALIPPTRDQQILPKIPVNTRFNQGSSHFDSNEKGVATFLIDDQRLLFIEGAPGSGKSTLCKRVVNHLAEIGLEPGARIIPIYVPLARVLPGTLNDAFTYACTDMGVRVFPNLYKESLKHAQVALILDGLDEIDRSDVTPAKLEQLIRNSSCSVMLTSRPTETESILLEQDFTFAAIRNLTDHELTDVFNEYLGDKKETTRFFNNTTPALKSALHSPLFALMAIRIAQSHPEWTTLSTYKLFEEYVLALHSFFNADTVRGTGEAISIQEVLSALSIVALFLQKGSQFGGISLDVLANKMKETGYERGFTALINLGLISVAGGRSILAHQSFQDFAIAHHIVQSIRKDDVKGFMEPIPSEFIYQLVHNEIGANEEAGLLKWLSSKSARVKMRVLGILHYVASPVAIDKVRRLLIKKQKGSLRVWSAAVRILVAHQDEKFLERIDTDRQPLSKRRLKILTNILRTSEFEGHLLWTLRLAENRKYHPITACAFELALKLDSNGFTERLIALYLREEARQRHALCLLLNKYKGSSLAQAIASILLPQEKFPLSLIYLLNLIRIRLPHLPESDLINACEVLSRGRNLRAKDCRVLLGLSLSLKKSASASEIHQRLLMICEHLGGYKK